MVISKIKRDAMKRMIKKESLLPPEPESTTIPGEHQAERERRWVAWETAPLIIILDEILKEIKGLRKDLKWR